MFNNGVKLWETGLTENGKVQFSPESQVWERLEEELSQVRGK